MSKRTLGGWLWIVLVGAALGAVGCGSDDDSGGSGGSGGAGATGGSAGSGGMAGAAGGGGMAGAAGGGMAGAAGGGGMAGAAGGGGAEAKCLAEGGSVFTSWCCKSNNGKDFPSTCSTACGCAPNPNVSDEVKMCNCGTGKCWDGSGCVTQ